MSLQKDFKPQNIFYHGTPHVSHTSMFKKVTTCKSNEGNEHHQGHGWGVVLHVNECLRNLERTFGNSSYNNKIMSST
jgi:hypothetical protein